ncbi:plasmid stabilization protein ParE [Bacteroidia bacterium]|nr:plasmid stabilization protein ParE [Bacteroidia bacterium]
MFLLTGLAYEDLKNVAFYTHETWGSSQRDIYLKMIDSAFHAVAENPDLGIRIDYVRAGYYKYKIGKHLIFYRAIGDEDVQIVRILHERMDVESYV